MRSLSSENIGNINITSSLCIQDLNRLIEHYNAPLVIGGISMGAAISLKVAVEYPENVLALILVRPAWISDSKPKNLSKAPKGSQLLSTISWFWKHFKAILEVYDRSTIGLQ